MQAQLAPARVEHPSQAGGTTRALAPQRARRRRFQRPGHRPWWRRGGDVAQPPPPPSLAQAKSGPGGVRSSTRQCTGSAQSRGARAEPPPPPSSQHRGCAASQSRRVERRRWPRRREQWLAQRAGRAGAIPRVPALASPPPLRDLMLGARSGLGGRRRLGPSASYRGCVGTSTAAHPSVAGPEGQRRRPSARTPSRRLRPGSASAAPCRTAPATLVLARARRIHPLRSIQQRMCSGP